MHLHSRKKRLPYDVDVCSVSLLLVSFCFSCHRSHFDFSMCVTYFFPLFTKPLHLYCLCYSTASLHANKEHQKSTVNWLDFHPVSAQWYPGSSRGNSPPTSHINAGALQYFMHSAQCGWSSPFFGYPAVFVMLKWRVMFDQTGPKVQGHDRFCSSAGPTAEVCRCFLLL